MPLAARLDPADCEWRYAARGWTAGEPEDDITWSLDVLEAAVGVWS